MPAGETFDFFQTNYDGDTAWIDGPTNPPLVSGTYRTPMKADLVNGQHTFRVRSCRNLFPIVCSPAAEKTFIVDRLAAPGTPTNIQFTITVTLP
jgi:hypothetical protein